jgi:fructokinase
LRDKPQLDIRIASGKGIVMRLVSVGEVLWDVIGDQEFLGGAPLNFSVSSQRLGNEVALVSAVGADRLGEKAIQAIAALGLSTKFIGVDQTHETGTAIVTTDPSGDATFVIKRPAAFDFLNVEDSLVSDLAAIHPDWIYFGTLAQTSSENEALLHRLVASAPEARCFYDLNLREGHWSFDLVRRLSGLASVIKLNEFEAETLYRLTCPMEQFSLEGFCRCWSQSFGTKIVCVTLGERGCAVWADDAFRAFPGFSVKVVDTVGAGDAFSAAFLHGLVLGWPMERTAFFANGLGAIVASRPGATPPWTVEEVFRLIRNAWDEAKSGSREQKKEAGAGDELRP